MLTCDLCLFYVTEICVNYWLARGGCKGHCRVYILGDSLSLSIQNMCVVSEHNIAGITFTAIIIAHNQHLPRLLVTSNQHHHHCQKSYEALIFLTLIRIAGQSCERQHQPSREQQHRPSSPRGKSFPLEKSGCFVSPCRKRVRRPRCQSKASRQSLRAHGLFSICRRHDLPSQERPARVASWPRLGKGSH